MRDIDYRRATERTLEVLPDNELSLMDRQVLRRKAVERYDAMLDIAPAAIALLRTLADEVLSVGADPQYVRNIAGDADELLRRAGL